MGVEYVVFFRFCSRLRGFGVFGVDVGLCGVLGVGVGLCGVLGVGVGLCV